MADNSSTTSFRADISQLKSAMQQAQRSVKLANSEFKAASSSMEDWSKTSSGLQAKLKQLNTTLTAQEKVLALQKEELQKTEQEYGKNSAAADKVRIAINNQEAAINKTKKEIGYYDDELAKAEKYGDNFSDSVDDMNTSVKDASEGFTVLKGVIADLAASAIKAAINGFKDMAKYAKEAYEEFDKGSDTIIAKTGATGEQLDSLKESYKTLSTEIIGDSETIGSAVGEVSTKFGLQGEELENLTKKFLEFSNLNNTDVTSSIDTVQKAMASWGVPIEEAGNLLDLLNATGQRTGASVDALASSLTTNAAVLKDMGFNIDEAATFLGNLETAGVDSTTVMAGLKKALANSAKEGKTTKESLAELQTEMENSSSNAEATTEAMELFGTKAAPAIAEACKSGRLNFEDLGKAMEGYEGNLDDTYDATLDATDRIKLTFQGMKTEVGSYISTMLEESEPEINSLMEFVGESFTDVMDTIKDNAPAIRDTLISIVSGLTSFIKTIITNFEGIVSVVKSIGTVLIASFAITKIASFATTIVGLVKTFQTLKTATEAATTAQQLLNVAQNANVIGAITAAVAGLVTAVMWFVSASDEERKAIETLNEYEQQQVDKVYEMRDAYNDLQAKRDETVAGIDAEFAKYEELATELDGLVDANGRVKEGYEDRAAFIVNTLNEAIGTEMELVDGVIQNYDTETESIYKLIEAKKAQAVLDANEEAYTTAIQNSNEALQSYITTQGIYNQNVAEMEAAQSRLATLQGQTAQEWAEANDIAGSSKDIIKAYGEEVTNASNALTSAQGAVGESRRAMELAEETYVGYQSTIQNYEGLSSAIISGDAEKISGALKNMENDFITAETGTKETLERQVKNMEENYESLKAAIDSGSTVVTNEMLESAKEMVDASKKELDKFGSKSKESVDAGMREYTSSLKAKKGDVESASTEITQAGAKKFEDKAGYQTAGENNGEGYIQGLINKKGLIETTSKNIGTSSVDSLNSGIEAHSPSKATTTSGENFGQGFINGMNNKTNSVWQTAFNLAKKAVEAVKAGQQEGSPSKLTYQSGKYFTEGYMNGIASMEKDLQKTVKTMTAAAIKTAMDLNGFNFVDQMTTSVADRLSSELGIKTSYLLNKIAYQNTKKLAEFDATIKNLENERDKKLEEFQSQIDAATEDSAKDTIKAQKKAVESEYAALIATQNKYKTAYQNASSEMLTGLTSAINDYSSKAQDLINTTIGGIASKYQEQYDQLIDKQNTLIGKLKSAGSLFEISGAGVMTVNDLKEQTKAIQQYTQKLQAIKSSVTADLFNEITELDMKEGEAFIDRLLGMSESDLKAYSKAYEEKMAVAQKASENVYKDDMDNVAKNYKAELSKAMSALPSQLESLGTETMKGFINGLTRDTDYMESEIKTFIAGMVDTFKKELQIHSPSKVMMKLGGFTGEGFVDGFKETISSVKAAAGSMVSALSSPLTDMRANLGTARALVGGNQGALVGAGSVVNNYNMVQNNTSPKALTALETYQARRDQIALVKAFM